MNRYATPTSDDRTCGAPMICRCLRVSEEVVRAALHRFELRTVKEVRQRTGAGDGCTACHRTIRQLLEHHHQSSAPPVAHAAR